MHGHLHDLGDEVALAAEEDQNEEENQLTMHDNDSDVNIARIYSSRTIQFQNLIYQMQSGCLLLV